MQIQLKQSEIIQALKLYITTQGINLNGKSVEVSFTAGRKDTGLSADVDIQDMVQAIAPGMVYPAGVHAVDAPVFTPNAEVPIADPVMEEAVVEKEEIPVKGASLFG